MSNTTRNRRKKQNEEKSLQMQMTAFVADFVPLAKQGGTSAPLDSWSDEDYQQGYSGFKSPRSVCKAPQISR